MQVFIVIGARGTGKSTLIEQRVKTWPKERTHIYDIERRYFPDRELPKIKDFLLLTSELKNSYIVYEESTIFFNNRGNNQELRQVLVQSRYNGNIIFLVYHSICAVPYYVYELADMVILFRTKDEENRALKKYAKLFPYYLKLQKYPHKCFQFKLLNGNLSPYQIIKL